MITDGLKQVKGMVYKLFLILLTIDLPGLQFGKLGTQKSRRYARINLQRNAD